MQLAWPPLPIILVCILSVVSAVGGFVGQFREIQEALAQYPPGWAPVAYAIGSALAGFFVFTIFGLWRMRRWALVARICVHVIAPIQMTLAWSDSWARFPLLGPFVSWFWFVVLLACTLPYWGKMTWRFP
jgi:hypothetical protein